MGALLSSNDANGSYTRATLEASPLPLSFTICSALMVEAWTSEYSSADMKMIMNIDGRALTCLLRSTEHNIVENLAGYPLSCKLRMCFPPLGLQRSSACLFVDSVVGKMTLVVDERLLGEEEFKREEDEYRPANFSLVLGANLQEE